VALRIDSGFSESNFESSVISPKFIPGVVNDPVISSISNDFNGMSSEGISRDVSVDSSFVVEEVFVDGEGSGDGSVGDEVLFDVIDGAESVGRGGLVFVVVIADVASGSAGLVALGGHLGHVRAGGEAGLHVVGASFHGVRIAG